MVKTTISLGIVLVVLGLGAYGLLSAGVIGQGRVSATALIPAFFGVLFAILGLLARRPPLRKHMMHAAAVLAVLGFLGTFSGVIKLLRYLSDSLPEGGDVRLAAWTTQSIMAVLMVLFLGVCIRSFIQARRARTGS